MLSGLLTSPDHHPYTLRTEVLVHLAVLHCSGAERPSSRHIDHWMNREFRESTVPRLEDPVGDVFVSNVVANGHNYMLFNGIWEMPDGYLQSALDVLESEGAPARAQDARRSALSLVALGHLVASRNGLERWSTGAEYPESIVRIAPKHEIGRRAHSVFFSDSEVITEGIRPEHLEPFVLHKVDFDHLASQELGNTSLERCPLLRVGDGYLVTLPSAISVAARLHLLGVLASEGLVGQFGAALGRYQTQKLIREVLPGLRAGAAAADVPEPTSSSVPGLSSMATKLKSGRVLHVVLLHDHLDGILINGLLKPVPIEHELVEGLNAYISDSISAIRSVDQGQEGDTLLVLGGIGREWRIGLHAPPEGWSVAAVSFPDLLLLATEADDPVPKLLQSVRHRRAAEARGVGTTNLSGDINYYAYWVDSGYRAIPLELPIDSGSMLALGCDHVRTLRAQARRRADEHIVPRGDNSYVRVQRAGRDSYFESVAKRDIYISLGDLSDGVFAATMRRGSLRLWLECQGPFQSDEVLKLSRELWSGLLPLLEDLLAEIISEVDVPHAAQARLVLDCSDVLPPSQLEPGAEAPTGLLSLSYDEKQHIAYLRLAADFVQGFTQPENTGERRVLAALVEALLRFLSIGGVQIGRNFAADFLEHHLPPDLRLLHGFVEQDAVDVLLASTSSTPEFIDMGEYSRAKWGLCKSSVVEPEELDGNEANKLLHKVVARKVQHVSAAVRDYYRPNLVRALLERIEDILEDRAHWRRTSRALLAIYSSTDDVVAIANKRERERATTGSCLRAVIEMAICEARVDGSAGTPTSDELDRVLAEMGVLVEAGMDSDALYGGVIEQPLRIYPNGEYRISRSYFHSVVEPFTAAAFAAQFKGAASEYEQMYRGRREKEPEAKQAEVNKRFAAAFRAEYGLTFDNALDCWAELIDVAVETHSRVVTLLMAEWLARLHENRSIDAAAAEAFLGGFSLRPRQSWITVPSWAEQRDIRPWRYQRKLSLTTRPIIRLTEEGVDTLVYGLGALREGVGYVTGASLNGSMPAAFFQSDEMRAYQGHMSNKRGHAFEPATAKRLREAGWSVVEDVAMSSLGAPKELGNIDVLAWRSQTEVELVECKHLKLTKTVSEIIDVCNQFKGEASDRLSKHLRRMDWVQKHPESLQSLLGFVPDGTSVRAVLVTNVHVPMSFVKGLPLPADRIGPLDEVRLGEIPLGGS
jgi:Holliday junction resolvase